MENKERIKKLMNDKKRRTISEISEELEIHPMAVHRIFLELDREGYWVSPKA